LQKLIALIIPVLLAACATNRPPGERLRAVQSAVPGVPVPLGSEEQSQYDGGGEVLMVFYAHPWLGEVEVLHFFEQRMPEWGWAPIIPAMPQSHQLSFERDGVPVLIGVEGAGGRFSIIRGARGDWGFMPQLREPR
jgi:hypothetical protein